MAHVPGKLHLTTHLLPLKLKLSLGGESLHIYMSNGQSSLPFEANFTFTYTDHRDPIYTALMLQKVIYIIRYTVCKWPNMIYTVSVNSIFMT